MPHIRMLKKKCFLLKSFIAFFKNIYSGEKIYLHKYFNEHFCIFFQHFLQIMSSVKFLKKKVLLSNLQYLFYKNQTRKIKKNISSCQMHRRLLSHFVEKLDYSFSLIWDIFRAAVFFMKHSMKTIIKL